MFVVLSWLDAKNATMMLSYRNSIAWRPCQAGLQTPVQTQVLLKSSFGTGSLDFHDAMDSISTLIVAQFLNYFRVSTPEVRMSQ